MRQLGCNRLFLHARELVFTLPSQGKTLTLQAKLPEDLDRFLNNLFPNAH